MLSTQLNWKSGGRIISLALLGGVTLSGGMASVETPQVAAAPKTTQAAQTTDTWLTFAGPWLCRVWTGDADEAAMISDANAGINFTGESLATPVTLAWDGSNVAQVKTSDTVSTAMQAGATFGDTTIHCTRKWYVDARGYLISGMPDWVPDPTGALPGATSALDWLAHNRLPAYHPVIVKPKSKPKPKPQTYVVKHTSGHSSPPAPRGGGGGGGGSGMPPGGPSPWAPVPGHPGYGMSDFRGDPYSSYFGYCTWYAWYRHQGEPLMRLGNADAWAWNASHFGLRTGTVPVVGATAVFQPGVEGAGGAGHVAHVEAVLGGGWFIVSEMNFGLNGGGWGRVDWRFAYVRSGVTFIY